ncbi:MAG TPA: hypothetical protein VMO47_07840 [Rhodothermales bacterium]|nr:hypothetical protein [Rhodothermales bacterium]
MIRGLAFVLVALVANEMRGQGLGAESLSDTSAMQLETVAEDLVEPEPDPTEDRATRATWTTSTRYAFERSAGYASNAFAGPPLAVRSRLRARLGSHVAVVLVADHDAGEPVEFPRRVVDFTAWAVTLSGLGPLREVVLGAIRPRFGLGLSIWSGQRMTRPASNPSSFLRPSASVRANGSAYEAEALNGLGLDLRLTSGLRIVGFAARMTRDANVDETGAVTSMSTTGLHRNDRELESDDRLTGALVGASIIFDSRPLAAGIFIGAGSTSLPIGPGERPFQRHRFTGDRLRGGSFHLAVAFGRVFRAAGEIAVDDDGTPAGLLVARARAARGLQLIGTWREYPPRFNGLVGSPPGATATGNESGWTAAIEATSGPHRVRVFRDLYRRPWLQSNSYRPSVNSDWGFEANREFDVVRLVVRYNSRVTNGESRSAQPGSAPYRRRGRLRVRAEFLKNRSLRPSLDLVFVGWRDDETETGQGIGQRLVWSATSRVAVTLGTVFFKSDSGSSGVYLYEPDLPHYLAVPLLSGSGQRVYAILTLSLSRLTTIWVKGAATRYDEKRVIGSGVDRVTASQLRSLSFALRFRI